MDGVLLIISANNSTIIRTHIYLDDIISIDRLVDSKNIVLIFINKLHDFHRTSDRLPEEKPPPIEFYVEKLKNFDYEVDNVTDDQMDVKAPEHEIFELLSGQHIYL